MQSIQLLSWKSYERIETVGSQGLAIATGIECSEVIEAVRRSSKNQSATRSAKKQDLGKEVDLLLNIMGTSTSILGP